MIRLKADNKEEEQMKHVNCVNFLNLDCEKGMCALSKAIVPIDGEGSGACQSYQPAPECGNCRHFYDGDKYGMGVCKGYEKENWAYATCGAFSCEKYESRRYKEA